ncbi:Fic family protein [Marivirga sp. S37H4]|uniref:Fic family protein n=1 Tax=Marivirga aurantiaca TaxID=2802615 RepID=A0A935C9L4_9BACT|nr:Fic family protein [Marivirga aurantiaca]
MIIIRLICPFDDGNGRIGRAITNMLILLCPIFI